MNKITIAIDGYSSTGKSTLAKQIAQQLGYVYIDTGAMYRAVTWYAMQNDIISSTHFDEEKLIQSLPQLTLKFVFNPQLGFGEIYLNNLNVEPYIRTIAVSELVSQIAKVPQVRKMLVAQQQQMGTNKGVVMDGRDIGTVVFPNAEVKLFMTATPQVRAQRRFKELTEKGEKTSVEQVYNNLVQRDQIDSTREDSPLTKAPDAVEIDNSQLTPQQQLNLVMQHIQTKI